MNNCKKILLLLFLVFICLNATSQIVNDKVKLPVGYGIANYVAYNDSTNETFILHSYSIGANISRLSNNFKKLGIWEISQNGINSWLDFVENSNVFIGAFTYDYVTPWDFQVGSKIVIFNKVTNKIIKTIPQDGLWYNSLALTKDTLIIFNSTIATFDSLIHISKFNLKGKLSEQKVYNISAYGSENFKVAQYGNYIYMVSRRSYSNTQSEVFVTRLNINGKILNQSRFIVNFNSPKHGTNIKTILISKNNIRVVLDNIADNAVTGNRYYLFSTDSLGTKLWEKPLDVYQGINSIFNINNISDSTFISYGYSGGIPRNIIINKYDLNGVKLDSMNTSIDYDSLTTFYNVQALNFVEEPNNLALLVNYNTTKQGLFSGNFKLIRFNSSLNKLDSGLFKLNSFKSNNVASIKSQKNDTILFIGSYPQNNIYACRFNFKSNYEQIAVVTGLENNETNQNILVYPNPWNNSNLNIISPEPIQSISIINTLGQLVYEKVIHNTNYEIEISKDEIKSLGSMFIMIKTEKHTYYQKLINN